MGKDASPSQHLTPEEQLQAMERVLSEDPKWGEKTQIATSALRTLMKRLGMRDYQISESDHIPKQVEATVNVLEQSWAFRYLRKMPDNALKEMLSLVERKNLPNMKRTLNFIMSYRMLGNFSDIGRKIMEKFDLQEMVQEIAGKLGQNPDLERNIEDASLALKDLRAALNYARQNKDDVTLKEQVDAALKEVENQIGVLEQMESFQLLQEMPDEVLQKMFNVAKEQNLRYLMQTFKLITLGRQLGEREDLQEAMGRMGLLGGNSPSVEYHGKAPTPIMQQTKDVLERAERAGGSDLRAPSGHSGKHHHHRHPDQKPASPGPQVSDQKPASPGPQTTDSRGNTPEPTM